MAVSMLLVVVAMVIVALWWLLDLLGPSLSHFPTPKGWPILGNLLQLNHKRPELTFTEWTRTLGDVFVVKLLNKTFVVVNSLESINEVLINKGDEFAGRPTKQSYRVQFMTDNFDDIINSNPHPQWKLMRKVVHRHIKMYDTGMKRIEAVNQEVIAGLVNEFLKHGGHSFNPRQIIYNTTMNIMTTLLVNKKYAVTDKEFQLFTEIERILATQFGGEGLVLDVFPWLRFFGNKTYKALKHVKELRDDLWEMVKLHAQRTASEIPEEQGKEGLVHAFLNLLETQRKEQPDSPVAMAEINLKLVFLNLIVAGSTTTANSIYSFLNILSHHPEVQKGLQEEVDKVVGKERLVLIQDCKNMPFTQAVILELLRYTTIVPIGAPHDTLCDTTIGGKSIPAGVEVLTNLWGLHHDEKFWDRPYKFMPERFLDPEDQVVDASHENRRHLLAFGAGPRVCLGEILATSRLFMFIATIAQVFDVEHGTAVKVSCDPRHYGSGVVLYPDDFEIKAFSRNDTLFA